MRGGPMLVIMACGFKHDTRWQGAKKDTLFGLPFPCPQLWRWIGPIAHPLAQARGCHVQAIRFKVAVLADFWGLVVHRSNPAMSKSPLVIFDVFCPVVTGGEGEGCMLVLVVKNGHPKWRWAVIRTDTRQDRRPPL